MVNWKPLVPEDDYAALLEGVGCFRVRRIVHKREIAPGEFEFVVEFMNEDGSLFVLGSCCGATAEDQPPQSQFTYVVKEVGGRFLIQQLPPYVP